MKKILLSLLFVASVVATQAQVLDLFNPLYSTVSGVKVYPKADTVVNAATAYITNQVQLTDGIYTNLQIGVTKISGTVAGTITILGSLDGVDFYTIKTVDTQTAVPTISPTDGSAIYSYKFAGVPARFIRVSWAGTGTMSASFRGKLWVVPYTR